MKPSNPGKPERSEGDIQKDIIKFLQDHGYFVWNQKNIGTFDPVIGKHRKRAKYEIPGVSDILGVLPGGKFLAIEVKKKGGYPTKEQKKFLGQVEYYGGLSFVARSVEDIFEHFDKAGYYLGPEHEDA